MLQVENFDLKRLELSSFEKAFDVLKTEKLIIDADYLSLIEAAERGYVIAACEMATLFCEGAPGLPRNYNTARIYIDVLKDYNKDDPITYLEALYNSGILEFNFGNFEAAKTEFTEAAKVMVLNLNPENWMFETFDYIKKLAGLYTEA